MDNVDELAALARIIICIKEYRQLSADYSELFYNLPLNVHLKGCLIVADYSFWQYIRVDGQSKIAELSEPTTDEKSSLLEFKLLLSRYKRSVHESLYWHWKKRDSD